jgi:hypothetical protein
MGNNGYYPPATCETGEIYLLRESGQGGENAYKQVVFVAYRPHPAEVIISIQDQKKVVHRSQLYLKRADGPDGKKWG